MEHLGSQKEGMNIGSSENMAHSAFPAITDLPQIREAKIKTLMSGVKEEDLSIKGKQVKMNCLKDYDTSVIIPEENLAIIGTASEIFLYDILSLRLLDVIEPSIVNSEIFQIKKEQKSPYVYILYWNYNLAKLQLVWIGKKENRAFRLREVLHLPSFNMGSKRMNWNSHSFLDKYEFAGSTKIIS